MRNICLVLVPALALALTATLRVHAQTVTLGIGANLVSVPAGSTVSNAATLAELVGSRFVVRTVVDPNGRARFNAYIQGLTLPFSIRPGESNGFIVASPRQQTVSLVSSPSQPPQTAGTAVLLLSIFEGFSNYDDRRYRYYRIDTESGSVTGTSTVTEPKSLLSSRPVEECTGTLYSYQQGGQIYAPVFDGYAIHTYDVQTNRWEAVTNVAPCDYTVDDTLPSIGSNGSIIFLRTKTYKDRYGIGQIRTLIRLSADRTVITTIPTRNMTDYYTVQERGGSLYLQYGSGEFVRITPTFIDLTLALTLLLANELAAVNEWDVSPDGTKVVFTTKEEIWTVNGDGSDPRRITENVVKDYSPIFDLDGKSILFRSNRTSVGEIYRINEQGRVTLVARPYQIDPYGSGRLLWFRK